MGFYDGVLFMIRMCLGLMLCLCLVGSAFADPQDDADMARTAAYTGNVTAVSFHNGASKNASNAKKSEFSTAYLSYTTHDGPREAELTGIWNDALADAAAAVVKDAEGVTKYDEGNTEFGNGTTAYNAMNYALAITKYNSANDLYSNDVDCAAAKWIQANDLWDASTMKFDILDFLNDDRAVSVAELESWRDSSDMSKFTMYDNQNDALAYKDSAVEALADYIAIYGNDATAAWATTQIAEGESKYDDGMTNKTTGDTDADDGQDDVDEAEILDDLYVANPTEHAYIPGAMSNYFEAALHYEASYFQYSSATSDFDEAADTFFEVFVTLDSILNP